MNKMIRQEITKLGTQHLFMKQAGSLSLLIFGMALLAKFGKIDSFAPEKMVPTLFNSGWLIVFFMVYIASQTFSMEFRYGTIKNILTHEKSRRELFLAKVVVLLGYSICLNLVAIGLYILCSLVLFAGVFQQESILRSLGIDVFGGFIGMWLFASLSLFFSLVLKNESLASMIGIATYFVSSLVAGVQFMMLGQFPWFKWNPFNMLNLANQLMSTAMTKLTLLSTTQLILGNLFYICVFLLVSNVIFSKKRV